jgi:hypothetical protein
VKAAHYRGQRVVLYAGTKVHEHYGRVAVVRPALRSARFDLGGNPSLHFATRPIVDDLWGSFRFANGQESGHIVPPCDSLPKPRPSIGAVSSSGVALFLDGSVFSRSPMGVMSSYAYPEHQQDVVAPQWPMRVVESYRNRKG